MLFGFQLIKKINLSSKAWKITTHFFFILELSLEYAWVFFIYMRNNHYCDSMRTWCYGLFFFVKKLLIYRSITSNLNRIRIKIFLQLSVFLWSFFPLTLMIQSIAGKGRESSLFLCTLSTCSRMFRQLFIVFHLRWLPIIKPSVCNYQALVYLNLSNLALEISTSWYYVRSYYSNFSPS